ncbi:MAG TPA: hypothetical protein VMC79_08130 [Rectinemataceae bacterium]|nr:hypothetical protein [Rectinemataceae bacterium]
MPPCRAALILANCLIVAATLSATGGDLPPGSSAGSSDSAAAAQAATPTAPETQTGPSADAGGGQSSPDASSDEDLLQATLPLDISTATFYELVAWARSLGLSDSGSASDLRARLYDHYKVKAPPSAAARSGTVITIERADQATYFKLDDGSGDVISASGGVVLTMKQDNGDVQRIEAQEITYDRSHNAVTARGRVRFVRQSGTTTETFIGETLSASLDDWSGVFLDGSVRRAGQGSSGGERGLIMSARTMIRRSKNVMVFDDGTISSSAAEDPHYAIHAAKVWILGDNEWAIADAVFSVGNVPVLWLPFFYYPGDEIVFHPVIGYRSREGEFVQTTTYLIGRKPAKADTTGVFKLSQESQNGPMVLKGLFLRKVDSAQGGAASSDSLKVMADAYSGLGAFAGLKGSFPKAGPFKDIGFTLGLGVSRSLFLEDNGLYSPFDSAAGYQSVWNQSRFLGLSLPLRYGLDTSASYKSGVLSASVAFPLFSDPYFEYDFLNRSEDMDWTQLVSATPDLSTAPAVRTSLSQKLDLNVSAQPKSVAPWLSSIDLTRFEVSMSWLSKQADAGSENATVYNVDPERQFFYPDVVRPVDASLTLKGNLYRYPGGSGSQGPAKTASPQLISPWGESGNAAGTAPDAAAASGTVPSAAPSAVPPTAPNATAPSGTPAATPPATPSAAAPETGAATAFKQPARAGDLKSSAPVDPWSASVDWTLTPSTYLEERFKSAEWSRPEDIDFSPLYSLISYRVNAAVDMKAAYRQSLATAALELAWNDQDQSRPYLYDQGDYASGAAAYRLTDYEYRSRRLGASLRLGSQPFADNWLWAPTSFTYSLDATLYGLSFAQMTGTNSDIPVYTENYLGWNAASITTNSAAFNLAIKPWDSTESLLLTVTMPPTTESYGAKLSLAASVASLILQDRAYRPSPGADFLFDPLTSTLNLGRAPWPLLSDTFVYDFTLDQPQSNTSSLTWAGLSAALIARNSQPYEYIAGTGWQAYDSTSFRFTDLNLGLSESVKTAAADAPSIWTFTLNSSLSQSLLRFSESTFTFGLTAGLKVSSMLDLSFSIQSQNTAFWRYYPELFPAVSDIGGAELWRRNFLQDLMDSLSIWDTAALHRGLFKLKSLSFKMLHDLEDWDLSIEASVSPVLNSQSTNYVLDASVSFLLTWKDLSEIKSQVKYDSQGISTGSSQTISY